ncbi:hypothetical protein NP118_23215 [Salmonella enterica]|nr:hypothetical protein [Salmonella enterica]
MNFQFLGNHSQSHASLSLSLALSLSFFLSLWVYRVFFFPEKILRDFWVPTSHSTDTPKRIPVQFGGGVRDFCSKIKIKSWVLVVVFFLFIKGFGEAVQEFLQG